MKKILLQIFFGLAVSTAFATGIQIDALISGIRNPYTDAFLSGGLVSTLVAGGTASKTTYMDAAMTTPSTNPIVLNAYGQALRFGSGKYKFIFKTSGGTTLWTLDNLEYSSVATLASKTANPFGPTMSVTTFSAANLTATCAANLSLNGFQIKSLATPTAAYDGANKSYVDTNIAAGDATLTVSLASSVASLTYETPTINASTTETADGYSITMSSTSWIIVDSLTYVNTLKADVYLAVFMKGEMSLSYASTSATLLAGGYAGMVDDSGMVYDVAVVGINDKVATETATERTLFRTIPFTVSGNVKVAASSTKVLSLSYHDCHGDTGSIFLSNNDRWVHYFRIK